MGLAPRCDEPAGDTVLRLLSLGVGVTPCKFSILIACDSGVQLDLLREGTRVLLSAPPLEEHFELGRCSSTVVEDDDLNVLWF